jgi:hypothetical protein
MFAAQSGHLEVVRWLLKESGAGIGEAGDDGRTALLVVLAAACSQLPSICWSTEVLTLGGDTLSDGHTIWYLLDEYLIEDGWDSEGINNEDDDMPYVYSAAAVTSLLRVMVLRGAPWRK